MAATNTIEIIIKATDKATKELKAMGGAVGKLGDSLTTATVSAVKTAAAIGGMAYAGKKLLGFGAYGAGVMQTAESFEMLLKHVGAAPDLLRQLQAASKGTISDMQLSATSTLLAGAQGELATALANATPELMEIAKAANKLNPSLGDTTFLYQSLATGIKRASPLILDNLGLTIRVGEANEAYAKALGKTVDQLTAEEQKQALLNETLRAGRVLIDQAGGSGDSAADDFMRLTAEVNNLKDALAQQLAGPLSDVVKKLADFVAENDDAIKGMSGTVIAVGGAGAAFLVLAPRIMDTVRALNELNKAAPWLLKGGVPVAAGLLGGNWLSQQMTGQGLAGWFTEAEGTARGFAKANELATESMDEQRRAIARAREEIALLNEGYDIWAPTNEQFDIMGFWGAFSGTAIQDKIAELKALISELSAGTTRELWGAYSAAGPDFDMAALAEASGAIENLNGVIGRLDPAVIRARNQAIGEMGEAARGVYNPLYELATAASTVASSFGEMEFDDQTLWKLALASGASVKQLSLLADTLGIATDAEIAATLEGYSLIERFQAGLISEDELNKAWQNIGKGVEEAEQALRGADLGGALKYQYDQVEAVMADITTAVGGGAHFATNIGKMRPPVKPEELDQAMKPAQEVAQLYDNIGAAAATLDRNMTTAWLNSEGHAIALQEPMLTLQGYFETNTEVAQELGRVVIEEIPDTKALDIHIEKETLLFERLYAIRDLLEQYRRPVPLNFTVGSLPMFPGASGVPGYAAGTTHHAGGWAMMGENGPELAQLPMGSRVYSAEDSARMVGGSTTWTGNLVVQGAGDPDATAARVMRRLEERGIVRASPLR
jgi:phosphoserine phosphatase